MKGSILLIIRIVRLKSGIRGVNCSCVGSRLIPVWVRSTLYIVILSYDVETLVYREWEREGESTWELDLSLEYKLYEEKYIVESIVSQCGAAIWVVSPQKSPGEENYQQTCGVLLRHKTVRWESCLQSYRHPALLTVSPHNNCTTDSHPRYSQFYSRYSCSSWPDCPHRGVPGAGGHSQYSWSRHSNQAGSLSTQSAAQY